MRLVKDEVVRKDVLALTLRVEQARDLLRDAAEHMRAAAHEDDPQHAAALLTLGGEVADYAEAILRNVNDGQIYSQDLVGAKKPELPIETEVQS
jgi:hypothetical protein